MSVDQAPFRFSTRDFTPRRRLDQWHAVLDEIGYNASFCNFGENFSAQFVLRSLGPLSMGEFHTSSGDVYRSPRDIARGSTDGYMIFQQLGAKGSMFRGGAIDETMLGAGDIVAIYADQLFASWNRHDFHHRVTLVPRSVVGGLEPHLGKVDAGMVLRAGAPMNRLLAAFLDETYDTAGEWPNGVSRGLGEAAGGLLAAIAGIADQEMTAAGELAFVHRRIRKRLRDPLLTPPRIAAECGMSLRKLHGLFEGSGDTFGSFVRTARLAMARAALLEPGRRETIAGLAIDLGFNSLATFYRLYRDAYGEAPGDTRAAAIVRRRP